MSQRSSCELALFMRKATENLERAWVFCNDVFKKKVPVRLTHMAKIITHLGSLKNVGMKSTLSNLDTLLMGV